MVLKALHARTPARYIRAYEMEVTFNSENMIQAR